MHQAISTNLIPVLMFNDVGKGLSSQLFPLKVDETMVPMEHQLKKAAWVGVTSPGPPQVRCCDWRRKPRGGAWHRPHLHPAKRPRENLGRYPISPHPPIYHDLSSSSPWFGGHSCGISPISDTVVYETALLCMIMVSYRSCLSTSVITVCTAKRIRN